MTLVRNIPWPRILAEGTIIVVSILLAFWIDAWWDRHLETKNLLEYLTSFEQELIENRKDIDRTLSLSVGVLKTTDSVFLILADAESKDPPESFAETIGRIYKIHSPVLTIGAYEEMVNSGSMRLIGNRDLSVRINQYMEIVSSVQSVNQFLWDTYYDLQVPFLKEHFVISDFGWESAEEIKDAGGLLSVTPKGPYAIEMEALRTREYWNLLYSWKEAYSDEVRQLVVARDYCDEILELLRAEMERHRA